MSSQKRSPYNSCNCSYCGVKPHLEAVFTTITFFLTSVDFFFGLLRECLDRGIVTEELLREEMQKNQVRHDAIEVIEKTPPLEAPATP